MFSTCLLIIDIAVCGLLHGGAKVCSFGVHWWMNERIRLVGDLLCQVSSVFWHCRLGDRKGILVRQKRVPIIPELLAIGQYLSFLQQLLRFQLT